MVFKEKKEAMEKAVHTVKMKVILGWWLIVE